MKLDKLLEAKDYYSSEASNITRQLGFAGIAIIWVFKVNTADGYRAPEELILPGLLFTIGLTCDFLHYVLASIVYKIYVSYKEKKVTRNEEFTIEPALNWPGDAMWWLKIAFIVSGYYFVILHLFEKVIS